jgi:hypothetical protein
VRGNVARRVAREFATFDGRLGIVGNDNRATLRLEKMAVCDAQARLKRTYHMAVIATNEIAVEKSRRALAGDCEAVAGGIENPGIFDEKCRTAIDADAEFPSVLEERGGDDAVGIVGYRKEVVLRAGQAAVHQAQARMMEIDVAGKCKASDLDRLIVDDQLFALVVAGRIEIKL